MKKVLIYTNTIENFNGIIEEYNKSKNQDIRLDVVIERKLKKVEKIKIFFKKYDIVISDYYTELFRKKNKSLFMCHGYGTKQTPGLNELKDKKMRKVAEKVRSKVHTYITLSEFEEEYFYRWGNDEKIKKPIYKPLGISRTDELLNKEFIKKSRKKLEGMVKDTEKYILYAPTWRGYKTEYIFKREEFEIINKKLNESNITLIIKQHPYEEIIPYRDFKGLNRIKSAEAVGKLSTNEWLASIDMLITDYSSIYVDYLLLDRPLAFIPYDIERYQVERGLAIRENRIDMPGEHIKKLESVIEVIGDLKENKDRYLKERKESIKKFHKFNDGKSSERIWKYINELLKDIG